MAEPLQDEEETRLERAAQFFVSLLDDPSPAVRRSHHLWLKADPRNAVAYARIEAAWEKAGALRSLAPALDHDVHVPRSRSPDRAGGDQQ